MSDTVNSECGPMTDAEIDQIEAGVAMSIRQPVMAPRYLKDLLRRLNASLGKIVALEQRIAVLEQGVKPAPQMPPTPPAATANQKQAKSTKQPDSLDSL